MPDEVEVLAAPAEGDAGGAAPAEEAPVEPIEGEVEPSAEPIEGDGEPPAEGEGEGDGKPPVKEPELAEFQGTVSARLKELDKRAPGLSAHLNKFPQVRDAIAATFRREAAFRELYPGGLQEAQALREAFPRGMDDVQQVLSELDEIGNLDGAFYTRNPDGTYPGHQDFIANLASQDKAATVALLKRTPAEWAKLDPESYNQAFSGLMARTFENDRVYEHMDILADIAKELKNPDLTARIQQLQGYLTGFKPQRKRNDDELTPRERELKAREEEINRRDAQTNKETGERFHQTLVGEYHKFARDLISGHALIKNLPKAITPVKKQAIVDAVRKRVAAHLEKSRPFKAAFDRAYVARDQKAAMEAQKNYWTPWLVNMYVRKVLAEETPGLVAGSQARPGAKGAAKPAPSNGKPAPRTKAYQGADKRWYRPDGSPYTTQEVLRGAHLQ
jgi:hypothetical protein